MISVPDYATYRGMVEKFQKVYENLDQIISNTEKFFWHPSDPEEYIGPIKPVGIVFFYITYSDYDTGALLNGSEHWLILAENVPAKFVDLEFRPGDDPHVLIAPLDNSFKFKEYNKGTKSLMLMKRMQCRGYREATIENLCNDPEYNVTRMVWNAKISMEDKLRWREENP